MDNKKLFIIFAVLLAVFALTKLLKKTSNRSFTRDIITVDTSSTDQIILNSKTDNFEDVTLTKNNQKWKVTKGALSSEIPKNVIEAFLTQISDINAKRIASAKKEKWGEYELEEKNGIRIQVFSQNKLQTDFTLGRYSFNQQARTFTSFLRLQPSPNVYAVDTYLPLSLQSGFDGFRNKVLYKNDITNIKQIDIEYLDNPEKIKLIKTETAWMKNEKQVSNKDMNTYLSRFAQVNGSDIVENTQLGTPLRQVTIKDEIGEAKLQVYENTSTGKPFLVRSTRNTDLIFASDSTGLFSRLFEGY